MEDVRRYLELSRLEVKGVLIPSPFPLFMKYFEGTPEYEARESVIEKLKLQWTFAYGTGANEQRPDSESGLC
jgi:hypothetical protein